MASFNNVILIGHFTADPELKQTPNGVNVCRFSIGVNRRYEKETTDFFNIVAWRQTAEFVAKYFKKGDAVLVSGTLQNRQYAANDGTKRTVTEIVAGDVNFVSAKKDGKNDAPKFEEITDDGELPF